jgi:hypothetical protein
LFQEEDGGWHFDCDGFKGNSYPINFCPFCGEKLQEDNPYV